ncbi:MAG: type VI secretion system contractile sheath small subunit [Tepidisphaeraceae bacterium]
MAKGSQDKVKSRVNIKYEVETGGAKEVIDLPFVMGVMADLSGQRDPKAEMKSIENRKFEEFTQENFDNKLKAIRPRVAFQVPNALSNDGQNLNVELKFESMDDFSPAAIARKVEPLRKLLELRAQITNLITSMDGKPDVEAAVAKLLADPAMLRAIGSGALNTGEKKEGKSNG